MTEYSPPKTGKYPRLFPNFQNCACCEKYLKDNKHNSLQFAQNYARIFVLGRYLFLKAQSFPRATLSENCSLLGTDIVRRQISEHIFAPNRGYCIFTVDKSVSLKNTPLVNVIRMYIRDPSGVFSKSSRDRILMSFPAFSRLLAHTFSKDSCLYN